MQAWGNLWAYIPAGHRRLGRFLRFWSDRRQRHQHHAGNSGHQPDHLDCFSLPFRRHCPTGKIPSTGFNGATLFMPATYLATGLEFAATNLSSWAEILTDVVALALGLLVAFEISRQLFRWEPEAKAARSRQALGTCGNDSFYSFRRIRKRIRTPPQPREVQFSNALKKRRAASQLVGGSLARFSIWPNVSHPSPARTAAISIPIRIPET